MDLVIVESPTKSKTLQGFLGPKYKVLSSYGHIRDLPKSELGIDIENNFKPKYIVPLRAKKNVNILKKESEKANLIILATDEDREGEAIAYHLVFLLGLNDKVDESKDSSQRFANSRVKEYQRVVFHEITKSAIEKAFENPRKIDMNLVNAQQARRVLDRIVGYKLSPFLWKKIARGLSAGRVQSVAVRLVVEREKEIENFISQEYWTVEAKFQQKKTEKEFLALLIKKDGKVLDKLAIKNKNATDKIIKDLKGVEYKVENVEKKEVKRNPLPPFTTSTLQQTAWQKFRFPARLTMRIAQNLYEKGFITYHRTDSLNLSDLSLGTAKKFITKNYGQSYYQFRRYKAKGRTQEAHEAIRPAYPDRIPEKLDQNQLKLYDLIWQRFIACQMAQEQGAEIIGLALLLGKIGRRGLDIRRRVDIPMTNGDSYLVFNCLQVLMRLLNLFEWEPKKVKVAVYGFPSIIGTLLTECLLSLGINITLITKLTRHAQRLINQISDKYHASLELASSIKQAQKECKIIFTAGAEAQIVDVGELDNPAIIIDVSFPRNAPINSKKALVIDTGIVSLAGRALNVSGFYPNKVLPCLTELITLSLEERREDYSLGRNLTPGKVEEIGNLAQKYGFEVDTLYSFGKPIDMEYLSHFKDVFA